MTERRFVAIEDSPVQLEEREGKGPTITGYASVFYNADEPGTEFQLFSGLVERIMPRAFNRALQEKHDARGLFNHDPNMILGRVGAKTLRLSKDTRGLRYQIDVPNTNVGRDVAESIRRGDVTGSSFAFRVIEEKFIKDGAGAGVDVREIHSVELFDVSPVVYPAYQGTSTALRSQNDGDEARKAWESWRASEAQRGKAVADKLASYKTRADAVEV